MADTNWLEISNKKVIVTGGNSGFGLSIATELKKNGATVIIVDKTISKEVRARFSSYEVDITDVDAIEEVVKALTSKYNSIDILINNAGISIPGMLVDYNHPRSEYEITESDFYTCFDVNVKGTLFMTKFVVENMIANNVAGKIINISSTSSNEGSIGQSIYAASKNAINSFTRSFSKELGKFNIKVIGVAPGIYVSTGLTNAHYTKRLAYTRNENVNQLNKSYGDGIPLRRVGQLEEIGYLVAFLASDKADYITGSTINISGGKTR